MAALQDLIEAGQSYWLDNLSRDMLESGELERRVRDENLRGVTSNPSTFQKSVARGDDYSAQLRELGSRRLATETIYQELAVSDVRRACDLLRPVWETTNGVDGFVSLEVSPYLAHDTSATMAEARHLSGLVDRPNLMIKIPATRAGIPAIEQMLYEGIHVNITLLFSVSRYQAVAEAYLKAMERRVAERKPVEEVSSVASFFLSRIDVLADSLLAHRLASKSAAANGPRPGELLGKAAVANAKVAYQTYKRLFSGDRWHRLADNGTRVQRLLWASTSTKNPLYQDVRYVEPLVGRDTVSTMPENTIEAFADHGVVVADVIESDVADAEGTLEALSRMGLDLDRLAWQLENEGIQKFVDPFDETMEHLARQRTAQTSQITGSQWMESGPLENALRDTLDALTQQQFAARLLEGDPTLRRPDHAGSPTASLRILRERLPETRAAAEGIRESRFTHAVILAGEQDRLCIQACSRILGTSAGWLELVVPEGDLTDLRDRLASLEAKRTLFVSIAEDRQTSGEAPAALAAYRLGRDWARRHLETEPADHFVTVAAPDSPEYALARSDGCRRIFEAPRARSRTPTALSLSSFLPMALMGADLEGLVDRVELAAHVASTRVPPEQNPAIALGALLGTAGAASRHKVWFLPDETLADLARWAGRLLEQRTGLTPVFDDPSKKEDPTRTPQNRVVVCLSLAGGGRNNGSRGTRDALARLGFPIARIELASPLGLAAELHRWELASVTAARVLGTRRSGTPIIEPTPAQGHAAAG